MKKLLCIAAAFTLALSVFGGVTAFAEGYDVEVPEGYNLATNEWNWAQPTLGSAKFTADGTGLRFEGMTNNNQCMTMFRGGRFGEFKLSLYVDAHLTVPQQAQWKYSEFFISFLVDRDVDDPNFAAEDAKPWHTNKVYMTLCFGLTSGGVPICKFMNYEAYAGAGDKYDYCGTTADETINIVDGNKHWVELEVKNFSDDSGTGKIMKGYIDGTEQCSYTYYDDTYTAKANNQDYEVNISEMDGSIGLWANSDWPGGYSLNKMDNYMKIEKMVLKSYDANPEGEYVGQCSEPVFRISAKDYIAAASYSIGDPVEIQLVGDMFDYAGNKPVSYEVTCDGSPIGEVTSNGFWSWTPTRQGNYDVTFKATVDEDNTATNFVTFRVGAAGTGDTPSDPATPSQTEDKGGCSGALGTSALVSFAALAAFAVRRKRI